MMWSSWSRDLRRLGKMSSRRMPQARKVFASRERARSRNSKSWATGPGCALDCECRSRLQMQKKWSARATRSRFCARNLMVVGFSRATPISSLQRQNHNGALAVVSILDGDQLVRFWIVLNAHLFVLVKQSFVVHLPAYWARFT